MKKTLTKGLKLLAVGGLMISTVAANSACFVWMHQPKMPDKFKSLRKF